MIGFIRLFKLQQKIVEAKIKELDWKIQQDIIKCKKAERELEVWHLNHPECTPLKQHLELKRKYLKLESWHVGIPDGLSLKCPYCKQIPKIDYHVPDELWNTIVPKKYKLGVVCLNCFAKLAKKEHILFEWIIPHIKKIFYATEDYSIELLIKSVYDLDECKKGY